MRMFGQGGGLAMVSGCSQLSTRTIGPTPSHEVKPKLPLRHHLRSVVAVEDHP
jgi:hypothetical protein